MPSSRDNSSIKTDKSHETSLSENQGDEVQNKVFSIKASSSQRIKNTNFHKNPDNNFSKPLVQLNEDIETDELDAKEYNSINSLRTVKKSKSELKMSRKIKEEIQTFMKNIDLEKLVFLNI